MQVNSGIESNDADIRFWRYPQIVLEKALDLLVMQIKMPGQLIEPDFPLLCLDEFERWP